MSLDEVTARSTWRLVVHSLNRPYPVRAPMVVFLALVPVYIFIAQLARESGAADAPAIALDRAIPLQPVWSLIYGALYAVLIVLPIFVVRQDDHLRRTLYAYLLVWLTSYGVFIWYPTVAPRPAMPAGDGFGVWGLQVLYEADPPYNCFPSIHVAHSFVSALACFRVHRRLGVVLVAAATLVALSTLFTKQHYVLDVVAGTLLAAAAYALFLRAVPSDTIPELDRRLAPVFAIGVAALAVCALAGFWIAYLLQAR